MVLRTICWAPPVLICALTLGACHLTSSKKSTNDPQGAGDGAEVPPEFADEGEAEDEGEEEAGVGEEGEGEGEGASDAADAPEGGAHIPPPLDGADDPEPVPPMAEPATECGPGAAGAECGDGRVCDLLGCGDDAIGRCMPAVATCAGVFRPVCGCEGSNFTNDCERLAAAAARAHQGGCDGGDPCGVDDPCPEGLACDLSSCGEGALGACVPTPETCGGVHAPVCGCDGVTYGNECQRLQAGAGLDHEGLCEADEGCGGACGEAQACDTRGCGDGARGACVSAATPCAPVSEPVCGCDGTLYVNDCERLAAGVAQDDELGCLDDATCVADGDCPEGSTCDVLGCGEGTGGECVPKLDPCEPVYRPVCGCEGTTYWNDCERRRASVAKASGGPCP